MCNRSPLLIALTCIAITFSATEQWEDNNQSEARNGLGPTHNTATHQPGLYNVAQYIGALSKRTSLAPSKKSIDKTQKKPQKNNKKKEAKKKDKDLDRELNMVESFDKNGRSLANQFLLRHPRERKPYDVPRIDCPTDSDGLERFACPTDLDGRYLCLDDHVLCDGYYDCPGGEDEDRQSCMFYKTMRAHLDVVADALLRWVRGR